MADPHHISQLYLIAEAARNATLALKDYLIKRCEIPDLHEAAHFLLRGFAEADRRIMDGKEETWEAGTTTLIGCILLQLQDVHDLPTTDCTIFSFMVKMYTYTINGGE